MRHSARSEETLARPVHQSVTDEDWNCALPRRIENYVDFGHFAWVHDGVLGDSDHPEVPDHSIGRHRNELRFDHPHMAEPPDSVAASGHASTHLPAFRNMLPVLWKEGQRRVCCRSCGRDSKASCWRSCSATLNLKPV